VRYFQGEGLSLYRNQGDGTFRDVTASSGVASPGTRAFAPAIIDFDEDGWLDIFVASDGTPSRLWRNLGDGTFEDVGLPSGVVLDEGGAAYAGMGIDFAFPRNDGQLCVAIGNFVGEPTTMHCRVSQGDSSFHPGLYAEMSARTGIGRRTLQSVTFGLFFVDVDLDGFQDLFMVNGHVVDEARLRHAPRAQRPQLFLNTGDGRFQEMQVPPGSGLDRHLVGRGTAYADYDGDGDLDIVVQENQGPALLLRNDLSPRPHFLRVRLTGTQSNRDGIGADVRVHTDLGVQRQMLRTGVSYLSQSEFPLLFGLGSVKEVPRVEIRWPSGRMDVYRDVPVDTTLEAVEGRSPSPSTAPPLAANRDQNPDTGPPVQTFPAHVQAGIEAYHRSDYATAARAFEAAIPLRPDEPTPYRYLADIYWRQDQHAKAEEVVSRLAQAMPDAYFLDRQGSGYESSDLLGLAQLLYREAARLDPSLPSARFNLGRTYLEQGQTAKGIEEIQAAIQLHPEFAEAHETLGLAYLEQGQWEAAVRHLRRALDFKPDLAVARNHLGRLHMAQGRLEAAIGEFRQLIEQHPEIAEARHNLAVAYARQGQSEQALQQFQAAIRIQPDFQAARLDFAALASDMGRYREAIDMLEGMLTTSGASPAFDATEVRYRLALVHVAAQQLSEASTELQRVLQAQPNHPEALVYLSSIYYRLGQYDRAWRHARRAEALGAPVAELITALRQVSSEP
jgi:tetratricopeptide (TPR) repeat protein